MDRAEEGEVIKRVLKGDRPAFALLVEAYKRPIYNLAYRMTGSYSDADDLTQETFIRAYRKLGMFDPEKSFFTWLYTIGINLIRNHIKKNGIRLENEGIKNNLFRAEKDLEKANEAEIEKLERALLALPADVREAVILRFHADLTFEEMASTTGISVSALKMRVYRGLDKLKKQMEKEK